ncbi:pentapeptide repeat-containing protein [Leptolyngbya sp. FACHB-671]|uniref:pentapeptide repeat-containing protein n=1 Tax=Leptolyngbya sp. FACHB-671 TaxID=2692812 RepID=UPI001689E544|nr:pentapeptide repeat-containing protein [Leptolyngbya sp. FACHB-671]MBD2069248.1 pentapeptide repeat-containing protein [Leptolyngbya sp. FACHB-671]
MANPEHLEILMQGVKVWNQWREQNNDTEPDLSSVNLSGVALSYANFSDTNLSNANLHGANLAFAILSYANLKQANLHGACLIYAKLNDADLFKADIVAADLSYANLCAAEFQDADLHHSNLSFSQVLDAGFNRAIITGACIESWQIGHTTDLDDIECKYIFRKWNIEKDQFESRLPVAPNNNFAPGEFTQRFQIIESALETIDITFTEGIDWKAFFQSFMELRAKYQDDDITIQGINCNRQVFVISLGASVEADRAAIEASAKELYERNIKQLERQVENYAKLVEAEKVEKSTLVEIVKTMAESQGSKYDLRGSKFGGGFAAEGGYQEGGQFNDYSIQISVNIDEITKLIQSLKAAIKTFPKEQQADIEIEIEELQADLADEQKRDPKRLGKRIRSLWLAACAIAVGIAGVTDFSNNVLELSEKLNVPIPVELIQQNPHILFGG